MVIVPISSLDSLPTGYSVMKKRRQYKRPNENDEAFQKDMQEYKHQMSGDNIPETMTLFNRLAKKYDFTYRFGLNTTTVTSNRNKYTPKYMTIALLFIFVSVLSLFGMSKLTGNAMLDHNGGIQAISSLGVFVFGTSLAGMVLIYQRIFFNKKNTAHKS